MRVSCNVRENNQAAGKTWTYAYDDGGNILSKTKYAYTTGSLGTAVRTVNYGYGDASWSDLLTSIEGQSLTADEIGNLLSDGTWAYTWQHGRQLAGMSKTGTNITYGYDSDGKRITKTVNGTTYNYHYLGDQLVELTWSGNKLHFTYDSTGPLSVNYNGTEYFYVKNAQGDVTGLVNASGTRVVSYTYDAWGNPLTTTGTMASTLGSANPLRYRGYVYDTETGLYYLQSRYYNPGWGRFIGTDDVTVLAASLEKANWDKNLFAYCDNNPVSRRDAGGEFWHLVIGAVIGGVINGGITAINGGSVTDIAISAAAGALSGALSASGVGRLGQMIGNAVISASSNIATQFSEYYSGRRESFSEKELIMDTVVGVSCAAAAGPGAASGFGQKRMVNLGKQSVQKAAAKISKGPVKFFKTVGKQMVSYFHNTKPVTAAMFRRRSIRIGAINVGYNLRHKIASLFR